MKQNRRKHSPAFKARVALEALKDNKPIEIVYQPHPLTLVRLAQQE